jgi:hypothetical protein
MLELLQHVGFSDLDELRSQLTSNTPNMAKVFFAMLIQSSDLADMQLRGSGISEVESFTDFDTLFDEHDQRLLYRNLAGSPSDGSLTDSPDSFARFGRLLPFEPSHLTDAQIADLETQACDLMAHLQTFTRARDFIFLNPDDRLLIVTNPTTGSTFRLRAVYLDELRMTLTISQADSDRPAEFMAFVNDIRSLLKDFVAIPAEDVGEIQSA